MRYGLLALAMAVCMGLYHGWLASAYDPSHGAALSDEARAAIELRCHGREGRAANECRRLLGKLYLAGALDPETSLRDHCTPLKTVAWGARPPAPPKLCLERYGGWQKG